MTSLSPIAVDTHDVTEDYGTARLHTAKLVVMFSLPVAAGFVAGTMQNNDKSPEGARSAHRWMVCQVLLSLASSFAAAMALLLG